MTENDQQERHQMTLARSEDGGADELYCPTCGRKLLIVWGPEFQKIVVMPGDETAIHSAGSEGLMMGAINFSQPDIFDEDEKARLDQWEDWLTDLDFSSWWSQDAS